MVHNSYRNQKTRVPRKQQIVNAQLMVLQGLEGTKTKCISYVIHFGKESNYILSMAERLRSSELKRNGFISSVGEISW